MNAYTERKRPVTVTRNLPHYVIGTPYKNLVRLAREVDRWQHHGKSGQMLMHQFTSLYCKVYKVKPR